MTRLGEITPCYTMRFERASKHPAKRLWRAITDPAEVTQWMGMPSARIMPIPMWARSWHTPLPVARASSAPEVTGAATSGVHWPDTWRSHESTRVLPPRGPPRPGAGRDMTGRSA